jgi:hypothetical protein
MSKIKNFPDIDNFIAEKSLVDEFSDIKDRVKGYYLSFDNKRLATQAAFSLLVFGYPSYIINQAYRKGYLAIATIAKAIGKGNPLQGLRIVKKKAPGGVKDIVKGTFSAKRTAFLLLTSATVYTLLKKWAESTEDIKVIKKAIRMATTEEKKEQLRDKLDKVIKKKEIREKEIDKLRKESNSKWKKLTKEQKYKFEQKLQRML